MPTLSGAIWSSIGGWTAEMPRRAADGNTSSGLAMTAFVAMSMHWPSTTWSTCPSTGAHTWRQSWCGEIVSPNGMTAVSASTGTIAKIGARLKRSLSAFGGMKSSLKKNFTPSAAVCRRPAMRSSNLPSLSPARFGPTRSWIIELRRRSTQVSRPATLKRNPTMMRIFTTVKRIIEPVTGLSFSLATSSEGK
jgi:hypothetical protein